ncbi:MAG TPA: alkaline phosphatase family protein [Oscillospiraceae bacterium]|nr:alkaline phosphatase family protein [Oscillospiraceae bacterium]
MEQTDSETFYLDSVCGNPVFQNRREDALPQTIVFSAMRGHLEKGGKVLVLGYDGARCDMFGRLSPEGGTASLLNAGGTLLFTYAGGANWPAPNPQITYTGPGWAAMLTGMWSAENGVSTNYVSMKPEVRTLLSLAVEQGIARSSCFLVSWVGHFTAENATYLPEKAYCEAHGLPVEFQKVTNDAELHADILRRLRSADCPELIFAIYEACDDTGHTTGYGQMYPEYRAAFDRVDRMTGEAFQEVQRRERELGEDWLVLLTSDHGGYGFEHNGPSVQERTTFLAASKKIGL